MAFPEGKLSDWMLVEEDFSPRFDGRESRVERFFRTFWGSDEITQERVKGELVEAIFRWEPEVHSVEVLIDLADIAGYLQVEGALPGLIGIIDNKVPLSRDVESEMLRARVVSSVSAFATHEDAKSALSRWYMYDDGRFDWTCTEIICFGLIEGDPEDAQSLLERLLTRIDDPKYFDNPGLTASDLISFIKPDELERILKEIGTESAVKILSGMSIAREILTESGQV